LARRWKGTFLWEGPRQRLLRRMRRDDFMIRHSASPSVDIKYRIGVMPGPGRSGAGGGADFFWRFVEVCEKTAMDSVWFSERLSSPLPVPEPITAMAAVAARTTRLKFGPSVLITPFRSPVLAAREIAMVDYLSNGRMLPAFGIGADQPREFDAAA